MTQVKAIVPTTSFLQDQKHLTKSERFVAIQPAQIQTVLQDHGFSLVSLRSGQARREDRKDHQTTVARYRALQPLVIKSGGRDLFMDMVFKVPHLYGALEAFVGTWRQICSNGLVVGHKFVSGKINHTGDALSQLDALIANLVGQHDQLTETIAEMQARDVTPSEIAELAREVGKLRLPQNDNIRNVQYGDLIKSRRSEDQATDLFSVMNVLQENVMRHGLRYQVITTDEIGRESIRNQTARPVARNRQGDFETVRSVDLNASIWDAAAKLLNNVA